MSQIGVSDHTFPTTMSPSSTLVASRSEVMYWSSPSLPHCSRLSHTSRLAPEKHDEHDEERDEQDGHDGHDEEQNEHDAE